MLKLVPTFVNEKHLFCVLSSYYSDAQVEEIRTLYDVGSPWSLLKLFCGHYSFAKDFCLDKYHVTNDSIWWTLSVVGRAIEKKTTLLDYTLPKFSVPFSYKPGKIGDTGQTKLFFSLLLMVCESKKQGYSVLHEIGGGDYHGGLNHRAVANVFHKEFDVISYDPNSDDSVEEVGSVRLHRKSQAIQMRQRFDAPVFSDIFDAVDWDKIQNSIIAPLISKKLINGFDKCAIFQAHHKEVRVVPGINQLHGLCYYPGVVKGYDQCGDCVKWLWLARRYDLDPEEIMTQLVMLGREPCSDKQYYGGFKAQVSSIIAPKRTPAKVYPREAIGAGFDPWDYAVKDFVQSFGDIEEITNGVPLFPYKSSSLKFYNGVMPSGHGDGFIFAGQCEEYELVLSRCPTDFAVLAEVRQGMYACGYFAKLKPPVSAVPLRKVDDLDCDEDAKVSIREEVKRKGVVVYENQEGKVLVTYEKVNVLPPVATSAIDMLVTHMKEKGLNDEGQAVAPLLIVSGYSFFGGKLSSDGVVIDCVYNSLTIHGTPIKPGVWKTEITNHVIDKGGTIESYRELERIAFGRLSDYYDRDQPRSPLMRHTGKKKMSTFVVRRKAKGPRYVYVFDCEYRH